MYKNFSFEKTGKVMTLSKLQENQFQVAKFHSQKAIDLKQKSQHFPRLRISSQQETNYGGQLNFECKHALDYLSINDNRLNQSDGFTKQVASDKSQTTSYPSTTNKKIFQFSFKQKNDQISSARSKLHGSSRISEKNSAFSNVDNLFQERQILEKSTQQIYNYNLMKQKEEQMQKQLKKEINFIQKQIQEEQKAAKNINGVGTIIHQQKQKIDDNTYKFSEQIYPIKKEKEALITDIKSLNEVKKQMIQKNVSIIQQILAEKQMIESLKNKIQKAKEMSHFEQKNNSKIKLQFFQNQKIASNQQYQIDLLEDKTDILCTKAKQYAQIEIK
ncbi:hypothetical protein TTHERM_00122470 (macronuclear) [Tetrahymena thermophila SB210]|uniref:Uncharacterized protein n=1 Tax=Tetrahymena thermophila (strain SB210) TaxID=312017 RepID=Q22YS3_TETTS|nr:hypothetical protein TTHERM_00122470 [Tetrahymena thermophila SB210]EAR90598.2 hypothetical protein TTHERM_00122470 [Tetrahymena thermophila SB210]|eukprot:XP_001010843.2 hypothetical protein TTHERM_00122470 [Tetrahymena thermophila SB210]